MNAVAEPFVVARFREFYADVIRVRRAVLADPWGISSQKSGEAERQQARATAARTVSERFREILDRQAAQAGREGGEFGSRVYREAQYVMAGLADELFLHLDWEGREAWSGNLLETQLFGTHLAGEVIFDRMEKLLRERDDLYRDLAHVYLLALSLGFSGKFHGKRDGARQLIEYRKRLLAFIERDRPSILKEERHLFPQSYAHTLTPPGGRKLPYIGRWATALTIVSVVYILLSHVLWTGITRDLRDLSLRLGALETQETAKPVSQR